jgi:hypothetical protein
MDSLDGTRYVLLDEILGPRPEAVLLEARRLEAKRTADDLEARRLEGKRKADDLGDGDAEPEPKQKARPSGRT